MVIVIALLTAFFAPTTQAQKTTLAEITKLYQAKNYIGVINLYEKNKRAVLEQERSAITVSAAYERLRRYDDALRLNFDYLNQNHPAESKKIIVGFRTATPIDGKDFTNGVKATFYRIFTDYGYKVLSASSKSELVEKDLTSFDQYKQALERLEYQEAAVDKFATRVNAHVKDFEELAYVLKYRVFLDYVSWQTSATLTSPNEATSLLATNIGLCPGFGVSYENRRWAFGVDLSLLYGSGGVSGIQGLNTYQQENVPAFGGKLALGAGMIVSESRSELGLRFTLLQVKQNLELPDQTQFPNTEIEQTSQLSKVISIYSRWTFDRVYFQTDFGRYVGRPATLWSLGLGYDL